MVASCASPRSGNYPQHVKRALIIPAVALLLAGCGRAKDPFAGTWQADPQGAKVVIAAEPGGFRETTVDHGQAGYVVSLHRSGDTLVGSLKQTSGAVWTLTITHLPSGRLRFQTSDGMGTEMSRASDSTAASTRPP